MNTDDHEHLRVLEEKEVAFVSGRQGAVTIVCSDGSVHCSRDTVPPDAFCYYA